MEKTAYSTNAKAIYYIISINYFAFIFTNLSFLFFFYVNIYIFFCFIVHTSTTPSNRENMRISLDGAPGTNSFEKENKEGQMKKRRGE